MIGFDFPIRPSWVHDVHNLWKPNLPISELVVSALQSTMHELGGEKTRRNTLSNILHYFVRIQGKGKERTTLGRDAFATYSKSLTVSAMEAAYLTRIVCLNDVAWSITEHLAKRYQVGDELSSTDIRKHAAGVFGERKVVLNAASSYLSTLKEFGLLEDVGYRTFRLQPTRLLVDNTIFPLLVLSWSEAFAAPQIDLQEFAESPVFLFVDTAHFGRQWRLYQGSLWSLESRLGTERITLRYPEVGLFERQIIALLE